MCDNFILVAHEIITFSLINLDNEYVNESDGTLHYNIFPGWRQCSVECGTGLKTRQVTCRADGRRVGGEECNIQEKPPSQQLCHAHNCAHHTWFYTDWSEEVSHCFVYYARGHGQRKKKEDTKPTNLPVPLQVKRVTRKSRTNVLILKTSFLNKVKSYEVGNTENGLGVPKFTVLVFLCKRGNKPMAPETIK